MQPTIDVPRLHDTLRDCIQTPSPQTDMEAVRGFIRDVVRPRLQALPVDSLVVDEMGNLVALFKGKDRAAPFLFCTYAATYPPERMPDPFTPRIVNTDPDGHPPDNPMMWGRGGSEQMGALAAGLEAIRVYCEADHTRQRDVIFATTVAGEMGCHDAVEHMMNAGPWPYGPTLIASGTNNTVWVGNLGRIDVHVEIIGQSCHSSDPSKGRNAIEGARDFLSALHMISLPPADPDLGRPSLTPTFIASAPTASHTVPGYCRLTLDRRLIPGEDVEAALAEIDACRRNVTGVEVRVQGGRFNYPSKTPLDAPLVQIAMEALHAEGLDGRCHHARSALDAGFFRRQGVDVIQLGPGDKTVAHTDAEVVSLRDVEDAARVYLHILRAATSARTFNTGEA